jgi:hypothetical protein
MTMRDRELSTAEMTSAAGVWPLVLDAELCHPAPPAGGSGRLARLNRLMPRAGRFEAVSAELHCSGQYVRVAVTVCAADEMNALQLAADRLRAAARSAGLGPLVLVGARPGGLPDGANVTRDRCPPRDPDAWAGSARPAGGGPMLESG